MRTILLHDEDGEVTLTAMIGDSVKGTLGLRTQDNHFASTVEIPELDGVTLLEERFRQIADRIKVHHRVDARGLRPTLLRKKD